MADEALATLLTQAPPATEKATPEVAPLIPADIAAAPIKEAPTPESFQAFLTTLSPEDRKSLLKNHIADFTHDDLKSLPEWNKLVSRQRNEAYLEKKKSEGEISKMQNELRGAQLAAWHSYFGALQPAQRQQVIDNDPNMAMAYAAVKTWEANRFQVAQTQQTSSVLDNLLRSLQSDDTWSNIINEELWSDVLNTPDPAAAFKKLIDAGRDQLTKAEQTKLEAAVQEAKGKLKEPSIPAGTPSSAAGPDVDSRIMADPHSSSADKKAAFKRLYGFEYTGP